MEKEVTNKDIKDSVDALTGLVENLAISTVKGFEKMATKASLAEVKSDILELKTDLSQVKFDLSETKTDLKSFRIEIREQFEKNSEEHREMNESIEAIVGDYHPRIEKLEDEMVVVKTKLGVAS